MNPTLRWPDPTLPMAIHCAPGVLTELEMAVADGLLAMPRTGLGVGGLLLGRRGSDGIYVLRSVEIGCSHARGPSFLLTPEEVEAGIASQPDQEGDAEVVGWFCSKTSGRMELTEQDCTLFDALCPEPWQTGLLIWPSRGRATLAAFAFRQSGLGVPRELVWEELATFEASEVEPASVSQAEPVDLPTPVPEPVAEAPAVIRVAMPKTGTLFGAAEPARKRRKKRHPRLRLLVAAVVLAMLSGAGFLTRDRWLPRPRLALAASSDRVGRVAFLWNAEAIDGADHGSLIIDDGSGALKTIHLDRKQVRAGWVEYDCQPGRVTATLMAGDVNESVTLTARVEAQWPESGISK